MSEYLNRRTFAIISHPDAGKTTLTEKLLLYGGAIQMAGSVKGRKAAKHATSDWLALEKQRGISVTTSVMQFSYQDKVLNLLDTPGHEDFSEDTYRTLTAVDCALMVIDAAKGVEERTIKLMQVCRLRQTPIITFINKLDRDGRPLIELLDEIEQVLQLSVVPLTWPIGSGRDLRGIYHIDSNQVRLCASGQGQRRQDGEILAGLDAPQLLTKYPDLIAAVKEELDLVMGTSPGFCLQKIHAGQQTPVFFGSAIHNIGLQELLDGFVELAPSPQPRDCYQRQVIPQEQDFSGFVFKVQANMDKFHRDRIAFLRICSGSYSKGMKIMNVRTKKEMQLNQALTFMAGARSGSEYACAGDIIGIHNHGTIQIGDTFTTGEHLNFTGIPYFAPELFKAVRATSPLKAKALHKGLMQLSEEGAAQVFRPLLDNRLILGVIGSLQFDVVAQRLQDEYQVDCSYENVTLNSIRWLKFTDKKQQEEFTNKYASQIAYDGADNLAYLASSMANLKLVQEKWPEVIFANTREVINLT